MGATTCNTTVHLQCSLLFPILLFPAIVQQSQIIHLDEYNIAQHNMCDHITTPLYTCSYENWADVCVSVQPILWCLSIASIAQNLLVTSKSVIWSSLDKVAWFRIRLHQSLDQDVPVDQDAPLLDHIVQTHKTTDHDTESLWNTLK